jgi:hypothetical protein
MVNEEQARLHVFLMRDAVDRGADQDHEVLLAHEYLRFQLGHPRGSTHPRGGQERKTAGRPRRMSTARHTNAFSGAVEPGKTPHENQRDRQRENNAGVDA